MEAQGVRIEWAEVPEEVRARVGVELGSPVAIATNQRGGFSPGVAARCRLADGRRCFIKAVSADQNRDSPGMYRREAAIAAQLPEDLPVPALLTVIDDGHWVVLVFEDIDGHTPQLPWSWETLAATFAALDTFAQAATPCPVPKLESFAERHADSFNNFRRLAGGDPLVGQLDAWSREHLELLARLEDEWEPASAGDALLHSDVRALVASPLPLRP